MTELTTPDNIAKWTLQDPASLIQQSQTQGDSVQAALSKRQRYDYVWPTLAERTAQTGMVQGSRGYQIDTKSEYIFDNSNWRLASSYAEYATSGQSIPSSTYTGITGWTLNTTKSTDTSFTSISTHILNIVNPGVYAMSLTNQNVSGATGFSTITTDAAHLMFLSLAAYAQSVTTVSVPFFRVTASNTKLYLWVWQDSGAAQTLTSSVFRIGRIA